MAHSDTFQVDRIDWLMDSLQTVMKLELDLSDRKGLTEKRNELLRALAVVTAALQEAPAENSRSKNGAINSIDRSLLFDHLSKRFKIGNMLSADPSLSRSMARRHINTWVADGKVRIV